MIAAISEEESVGLTGSVKLEFKCSHYFLMNFKVVRT